MSQEAADQRQHNCKNDAEQRGSGNAFSHSFFIFCATALAETDAETTCKTIDKTKDKINDNAGGSDCCKGICPQCFTDDHRVSKCIKELKQITQNYGNCEF